MSWLKRIFTSKEKSRRGAPQRYPWCDHDWFVAPQPPVVGQWTGAPCVVRARTWAGCCMSPGEEERYPELLCLDIDGTLAPLKRAPASAQRDAMIDESRAWRHQASTIGAGPPYWRSQDPFLGARDLAALGWQLGQPIVVDGYWYPMFQAGTLFSFQIWGLYCCDEAR